VLVARPYVIVNVAASVDGKIDSFERRGAAISSERDRARVTIFGEVGNPQPLHGRARPSDVVNTHNGRLDLDGRTITDMHKASDPLKIPSLGGLGVHERVISESLARLLGIVSCLEQFARLRTSRDSDPIR